MQRKTKMQGDHAYNAGFTLIEVILVITIASIAIAVVLPNFGVRSKGEIFSKLGRLRSDIRAAYDEAILSGRAHRLVFHLASGDYWLESTKKANFYLGNSKLDRDLTGEEVDSQNAEFEEEFTKYTELAIEPITDPATGEKINFRSPVIKAKERLRPARWSRVTRGEWSKRSLGPDLLSGKFMASHHSQPITLEGLGEEAVAHLYFLPVGYVEKARMHIYYQSEPGQIDENETPYTMTTSPHEGATTLIDGIEEIDINDE